MSTFIILWLVAALVSAIGYLVDDVVSTLTYKAKCTITVYNLLSCGVLGLLPVMNVIGIVTLIGYLFGNAKTFLDKFVIMEIKK